MALREVFIRTVKIMVPKCKMEAAMGRVAVLEPGVCSAAAPVNEGGAAPMRSLALAPQVG